MEADPGRADRFRFVRGDVADPETVPPFVAAADAVVNPAAETHVDRAWHAANADWVTEARSADWDAHDARQYGARPAHPSSADEAR